MARQHSKLPPAAATPSALMTLTSLLAVALLILCSRHVSADCPDAYWDCLLADEGGLSASPSGGAVYYGKCWSWRTRTCAPCNPKDATDPEYILAKCNEEVMECAGGLCAFYADLNACCNGAGKCGNMEGQEQLLATACRGTVTS